MLKCSNSGFEDVFLWLLLNDTLIKKVVCVILFKQNLIHALAFLYNTLLDLINHLLLLRIVLFTVLSMMLPILILVLAATVVCFFALTASFICLFETIITHGEVDVFCVVSVVTKDWLNHSVPVLLVGFVITRHVT